MLSHESPLQGYARNIGGSAGSGTHGGQSTARPKNMPRRQDCDQIVRTPSQFANSVQEDDTSVYIDKTIDMSRYVRRNGGIDMGSGVIIVGGYCDPSIDGRGPEIVCKTNGHRLLTSCYGEAPSLWGVSMRGPQLDYVDPDHEADDFSDKQSTGLFCYDDRGTFTVVGCEFRGWTMAGLEVGAKSHETTAEVRRSSFHHNLMEHLGYGVQHYSGDLSLDRCFLDRCRHGISGFGYPSCSWSLSNSVVGPGPWAGHALDMHKLANNLSSGDETAGGDILIRRCSLMSTDDVGGYGQEAFALRGVPTGEARIERTHFWHESQPTETNVQGNAYRQEWESWQNFYVENCAFGAANLTDGVGAPRASNDRDEPNEPEPTMQRLKIRGLGGPGVNGDYSVVVHGGVESTKENEPTEQIEDIDGERTRISGNMWGGVDVFLLADDALPVSAELETPCVIWLDETNITGALTGVETSQRFSEQQSRLEDVQNQVVEVREWASSLSDSLSNLGGLR